MESESKSDFGQKTTKRFFDNLDNVFNYLSSQTYPANLIRTTSKGQEFSHQILGVV